MAKNLSKTDTLVLQSHANGNPPRWIARCLESVRAWSKDRKFAYRLVGDELFDPLSKALRHKLRSRLSTQADLGRLIALQSALDEGYESVVWLDADTLVFSPDNFQLPKDDFALGREIWLERRNQDLKLYKKVHNAFLLFRRSNSFLPFYLDAAQNILDRHVGEPVPQIIGPKLLTALHNMLGFPVLESAGALSPAVLADLADGGGSALERLIAEGGDVIAAANLCASSLQSGAISQATLDAAMDQLEKTGLSLPSRIN